VVVATRAGHLTEVAAALHEMFAALELLSLQSRQPTMATIAKWKARTGVEAFTQRICRRALMWISLHYADQINNKSRAIVCCPRGQAAQFAFRCTTPACDTTVRVTRSKLTSVYRDLPLTVATRCVLKITPRYRSNLRTGRLFVTAALANSIIRSLAPLTPLLSCHQQRELPDSSAEA
jgi:hypothetical protein